MNTNDQAPSSSPKGQLPDDPLRAKLRDYVHAIVKGGFSGIPLAGGVASEIFGLLVTPPAAKRLQAWMESVAEALVELHGRSADQIDSLRDNDLFITAVFQATQVAVRTHQRQKLEALRNIVLKTAGPVTLDEDIALLCIRLVEYLTPTHVEALRESWNVTPSGFQHW